MRWSIAMCSMLVLGCGERERELREWTPDDHQPAPTGAVVPEDDGAGEPNVGAALFAVHCATCHGASGHGDGPGAPPIARVPDLTDPATLSGKSDAEIEVVILAGRGFMPGFERSIPREGIRALVEYVRTLAPPLVEAAPAGATDPTILPEGTGTEPTPAPEGADPLPEPARIREPGAPAAEGAPEAPQAAPIEAEPVE